MPYGSRARSNLALVHLESDCGYDRTEIGRVEGADRYMAEGATMVVRGMELRDAAEVADLCGQLGYRRSVDEISGWISWAAGQPEGMAAFVATAGEGVVGWIEVSLVRHLQSPPYGLIGGLVVKDGFRGGGVGARLCAEAETWIWSKGVEAARVTSRITREGAHSFYRREGYEETKTAVVFAKHLREV